MTGDVPPCHELAFHLRVTVVGAVESLRADKDIAAAYGTDGNPRVKHNLPVLCQCQDRREDLTFIVGEAVQHLCAACKEVLHLGVRNLTVGQDARHMETA